MQEKPAAPNTLKRAISAPQLILYGLGTMLGAGIYALIGEVAGAAGVYAPAAFLLAAVIAGLTGFSFAELSARYPTSAGEAAYVKAGFRSDRLALIVGLMIVASGIVSSGVMFRGFIGYAAEFIAFAPALGLILLAIAVGGVAAWGIVQSLTLVAFITALETAALLAVIFLGTGHEAPATTALSFSAHGVAVGAALAFYAYIGFEDMVNVAEETIRPERTLPLSIIIALAVTTLIYVAVAWIAIRVVAPATLAASNAPMTLIFAQLTDLPAGVMTIVALIAVINGALVQIVMASRVLYGLAQKNLIPKRFGAVALQTQTPVFATTAVTAAVLIAALALPLTALAKLTSFLLLCVFALVNAALVRLKQRHVATTHFHVPMLVPVCGAITAAGLAAISLVSLLT